MPIGPRDKPSPLILHVNSATNAPAKIAEASAIYVTTVSAVTLSATTIIANNWTGLPAGLDGNLSGLYDVSVTTGNVGAGKALVWNGGRWQPSSVAGGTVDLSPYVLSATNLNLSSAVSSLQTSAGQLSSTLSAHLASAVHWELSTLNSNYINASGDSAAGSFYFGGLSASVFSATTISATNAYIASTVQFNTQITPTLAVGQMGWNSTDQTLNIQTTVDTTLQIGQEQVMLVENRSGAAIPNGKVVYVSGTTGGSGKLQVALAAASSTNSQTAFIIGVATQTINNQSTGFVTTFGKVNGIPLPGFHDGDIAYLGDTPGELRPSRPSKPSHGSFQMGRVINAHDTNGILFVTIRGSVDMSEIHDVASSVPATGQVLVWNNASGLYEPKNVSAISGINDYATTASLNNYVLTSVNTNLSSLVNNLQASTASISSTVSNHLTSAVHWTLDTLNSNYINASGDSVTGAFGFGSVSATSISATTYLNLPSGTATWNASALQGKAIFNANPVPGDVLAWDDANSRWTPSAVTTGAVTNTPGGNAGNIQFKNNSSFSGVDDLTYNSTLSSLYSRNLSSVNISAVNISATTYLNLPTSSLSGQADTQITTPTAGQVLAWNASKWTASALPLGNYVLTSTNNTLSSLVSNIQTSTLNLSSALGNVQTSTVNLSSTVSNLQTSSFNLSTVVGNHLASAVHWELATLNSNYINASGDSGTGAFYFQNLSGATFSATTYLNLPTSSLSGLLDTTITTGNVGLGKSLVWNGSKWQPSSITGGATSLSALLDTSVGLDAYTAPSGGQALIYSSSVNKWYPGYTIYQYSTAPVNTLGRDGDIYLQYTDVADTGTLSSLTDTQITTPTAGQVLAWNNTDWVASSISTGSPGAAAVGGNYNFQFYKDGNLSSVPGFGYDPTTYGGHVSSTIPISTYGWVYIGQNLGVGQGINLYGADGYSNGYLYAAPNGVSAVSANAFITPTLSATVVSASYYKNIPSGTALWNASALQGTRLNLTPTALGILSYNFDATEINAYAPAAAAFVLNPYFSLSGLSDTASWTNPTTGQVLKWNGSKWNPGDAAAGLSPAGSNYQIQFNNGGAFSAVQGLEYVPNLFGNPQLVLSGNVSRLYATNSIYTPYVTAATQLNLGPDSAIVTSQASSTVKVLSSILVPSAIFFGSGIPSTASLPAGIYYTGQSAQNVPPAIYQCNQDNLNVYVNFTNNKALRIVDQVAAAGGIAGSGYEFDGNSFLIQHGANLSAVLTVPINNVLQVQNAVSATTISATNHWNTIFKTTDESRLNTIVWQPDSQLAFYMDANKTYTYRSVLYFSAGLTGDIKFTPSATTSPARAITHRRTMIPNATTYSNIAVSTYSNLASTAISVSASLNVPITGPAGVIELDGTITNSGSANTFYIMWTQNAADNLVNTTVLAGSFMDWKNLS